MKENCTEKGDRKRDDEKKRRQEMKKVTKGESKKSKKALEILISAVF